ncbi:MAG: phosphoribosyltransferase family protein [Anaerolineae bacterium]|jgi:adenine phosphoribosyltransferase|nr:phosphoribosyltransferase family protein [Anaerolineae bacterium]
MTEREVYPVDVNGVKRDLRLFEVAPGLRIAILNILGDAELTVAAAEGLTEKLAGIDYDVFLTAEAKSIPLAHAIAVASNKPYVVLRKAYKPYMGEVITSETVSITTGKKQTLILDEKDHALVKGKKVILLDDVISTGSTLEAMQKIVEEAGGSVVARAAICTEGEPGDWADIVALGHLPLFREE